jgi:hypothetical protein
MRRIPVGLSSLWPTSFDFLYARNHVSAARTIHSHHHILVGSKVIKAYPIQNTLAAYGFVLTHHSSVHRLPL